MRTTLLVKTISLTLPFILVACMEIAPPDENTDFEALELKVSGVASEMEQGNIGPASAEVHLVTAIRETGLTAREVEYELAPLMDAKTTKTLLGLVEMAHQPEGELGRLTQALIPGDGPGKYTLEYCGSSVPVTIATGSCSNGPDSVAQCLESTMGDYMCGSNTIGAFMSACTPQCNPSWDGWYCNMTCSLTHFFRYIFALMDCC